MKAIPSIVIVEPKLLQLTYDVNNLQYDYENGMFRDAFIERAQKITNALQENVINQNVIMIYDSYSQYSV